MFNILVFVTFLVGIVLSLTPALADSADDVQCTMITFVAPVLPVDQSLITKDMVKKYMPSTLTPTTNASTVATQLESGVGQKISEDILAGEMFRKSSLGKATTKVEGLSQTSLTTSSGTSIGFKLKVVERQAVISIKGKINSEFIYAVDQSSFKWVLSKMVGRNTTLALTSVATFNVSPGASSILSLSHSF